MSKTKLNKRSIKIVGATSMALFSLVAVFTATIAWFASNNDTDATGMRITVGEEPGRLNKIEIYEYVETLNSGTANSQYSFKSTPSATLYGGDELEDEYFVMGDYTPLHTEHPLLILFTLRNDYVTSTVGDMYIKGLTTTAGFLGATNATTGLPVYNLGDTQPSLKRGTKMATFVDEITEEEITKQVDCYPLSSAVNFRCADFSSAEFDAIVDSTNGRINILNNLTDLPIKESFVNFAATGTGITFKKDPTIYSSTGDGSSIQYIAMVVNYDSNAISAIYSTYLGDSTLEGEYGGQLYFTCDWSLEVY